MSTDGGAVRGRFEGETHACETEGRAGEIETHAGLCERARAHAETVSLPVDLAAVDWEVSTRAKRRAGACVFDHDRGEATIRLTWGAFEAYGWERFAGVVRHELVHAWEFQRFGASDHGDRFERVARRLDAPVTCPRFATPRVRLCCVDGDCDWTAGRYRASAAVTDPGRYRCGACGARYDATHVESGRTWRSADGYERVREALGDDW